MATVNVKLLLDTARDSPAGMIPGAFILRRSIGLYISWQVITGCPHHDMYDTSG